MKRGVEVLATYFTDRPVSDIVRELGDKTGALVSVVRDGVAVDTTGGKWAACYDDTALDYRHGMFSITLPAGIIWRREPLPVWLNGQPLPERDQFFLGHAYARWANRRHGFASAAQDFLTVLVEFSLDPEAQRVVERLLALGTGPGTGSFMHRDGEIVAVSMNTDRTLPEYLQAH